VELYQHVRLFEDNADPLDIWKHRYLLVRPVSRRAHESICRIPLDFPDEFDSDGPNPGAAPSGDVVHRTLFPHFWTRDHFGKPSANYSFVEGYLTHSCQWLKSSLEDFVSGFELELVSDPQHPVVL
jgi:hypothetical protein